MRPVSRKELLAKRIAGYLMTAVAFFSLSFGFFEENQDIEWSRTFDEESHGECNAMLMTSDPIILWCLLHRDRWKDHKKSGQGKIG